VIPSDTRLAVERWLAHNWAATAAVAGLIAVGVLAVFLAGIVPPAGILADAPADATTVEETHAVEVDAVHYGVAPDGLAAYDAGAVVRDKPVYQRGIDPLYVAPRTEARGAAVEDVTVRLEYAAAPGGDDPPFWTRAEPLAPVDDPPADVGGDHGVYRLPVAEVAATLDRLGEEYGSEAVVTAAVRIEVSYAYVPADHRPTDDGDPGDPSPADADPAAVETGTVGARLSVAPGERATRLSGGANDAVVTSTAAAGAAGPDVRTLGGGVLPAVPLARLLAGVGLLAAAVSAGAAAYGRRCDPDAVDQRLERVRHREWVTDVTHLTGVEYQSLVYVETKTGLIDLAIDTRSRVLHVEGTDEYFVIQGNTIFVYGSELSSEELPSALSFGLSGPGPGGAAGPPVARPGDDGPGGPAPGGLEGAFGLGDRADGDGDVGTNGDDDPFGGDGFTAAEPESSENA